MRIPKQGTERLVSWGRRHRRALAMAFLAVFLTAVNLAYPRAVPVLVIDGNGSEAVMTRQATVALALAENGIKLDRLDRVEPRPETAISPDMTITVTRVEEKDRTVENVLAFPSETKRDASLPEGTTKVVQAGQDGLEQETIRDRYENNTLVSQITVAKETVKAPVARITAVGTGKIASRGGETFRYQKVMAMAATAYDPGYISNGKWAGYPTADGIHQVEKGVAAVDPRVIPLGTKLYVEGYGYAIAADTGGAIKGNRIDLAFNTYEEAIAFGMKDVTVYILE